MTNATYPSPRIDNALVAQKDQVLQYINHCDTLLKSNKWNDAAISLEGLLLIVKNNRGLWIAADYEYKHVEICQRIRGTILSHIKRCNPQRKPYAKLRAALSIVIQLAK